MILRLKNRTGLRLRITELRRRRRQRREPQQPVLLVLVVLGRGVEDSDVEWVAVLFRLFVTAASSEDGECDKTCQSYDGSCRADADAGHCA